MGVLVVGTRKEIDRAGLTAVIVANLLWVVLSLVVVVSGVLSPTGVGAVWVVLQSLTVGGFAVLQYVGLKRMRARPGRVGSGRGTSGHRLAPYGDVLARVPGER